MSNRNVNLPSLNDLINSEEEMYTYGDQNRKSNSVSMRSGNLHGQSSSSYNNEQMMSHHQDNSGSNIHYRSQQYFPGAKFIPDENIARVEKFIRPEHSIHKNAGMEIDNGQLGSTPIYYENIYDNRNMTPPFQEDVYNFYLDSSNNQEQQSTMMRHNNTQTSTRLLDSRLSCIDVSDHCNNCPICSKLYNQDRTVYIIIITILALICFILLKKVLNV